MGSRNQESLRRRHRFAHSRGYRRRRRLASFPSGAFFSDEFRHFASQSRPRRFAIDRGQNDVDGGGFFLAGRPRQLAGVEESDGGGEGESRPIRKLGHGGESFPEFHSLSI